MWYVSISLVLLVLVVIRLRSSTRPRSRRDYRKVSGYRKVRGSGYTKVYAKRYPLGLATRPEGIL